MKVKVIIGLVFLLSSCLPDDFVTIDEQLKKDIKKIDSYLAEHPPGIDDILIKDATGVRLVIHEVGTGGIPPNSGNTVEVNYTGKLFSNGNTFADELSITGKLPDFILGWQIGLAMLPEGSIATLYIPSGYAYGGSTTGAIPPNSILIFEVELESVTPAASQLTKLTEDIAAIDAYLLEQEVANVIEHESGIRYVITEEGTGEMSSSIYDQVKVDYTGKLLLDGTIFQQLIVEPTSNFSSRIVNFPQGLLIGLQLLQEGDKVTFYVPSGLAFGPQGVTDINTGVITVPPNANIIFEIELLDVLE